MTIPMGRDSPSASLDLFSTSPTEFAFSGISAAQERRSQTFPCIYNAPFFAYQVEGKLWRVTQGNCHHWDCPRCGLGRAKTEYGRMVEGCKQLADRYPLYFLTITCKGREETWQHAEEQYGYRTNRLLDACRARAKRKGNQWHYVQVTERQKRKHPHSHFISTFCPPITSFETVRKSKKQEDGTRKIIVSTHIRSDWFADKIHRAGLGAQYDITEVRNAEGASRYVAKYLFKPTIFETNWPAGWKRIRYSQSFPKQEEQQTDAIVLLSQEDWYHLAQEALIVQVGTLDDYQEVSDRLHFHDTIVRLKTKV